MNLVTSDLTPDTKNKLREKYILAETFRPKAKYDTGTISEASGFYLRGLCERFKPQVAVEVGTFIGKSTVSLKAGHVFTCDKDNDCLTSSDRITCFPFKTASQMLADLLVPGQSYVDFFFFDGRIQVWDVNMIINLASPGVVLAFDDYGKTVTDVVNECPKGLFNVRRMDKYFAEKGYTLVLPPDIKGVTIAVLIPGETV